MQIVRFPATVRFQTPAFHFLLQPYSIFSVTSELKDTKFPIIA